MFKARNHFHSASKCIPGSLAMRTLLLGLSMFVLCAAPGAAYAKRVQQAKVSTAPLASANDLSLVTLSLKDLGLDHPIHLRSADGSFEQNFSLRNDEVITAAKLKINYAWSPALIPELSHLKIMLNGELMESLPLPRDKSDGTTSEVRLDPSLFVNFNKLRFELIAHYTKDCEDPMHSSLWANISNNSSLELTVRHLHLPNDLGGLPAPFFDKLDKHKLTLPFIFPVQPGNDVLRAGGIVASWFGGLAGYRGARFPVLQDTLPTGNGVVFIKGDTALPAGLTLPAISGASLAIVSNPANPDGKLLLVMGRDANELTLAAKALTLGDTSMTGSQVNVVQLQNIPARKPYDAPNWIPTDRPVHFGELSDREDLQVEGFTPAAIRINFSLPPDIFAWQSKGVPLDLHYRYTIRPNPGKSTLNVNVNDSFVRSLGLASTPGKIGKMIDSVLESDGSTASSAQMYIPKEKIFGQNQLQLRYFFDYAKQGSCKDVYMYNDRGAIDQSSTIDFSSFPHYTALPNLSYFVYDGFPYTRMADLSETAVVMPNNPARQEMETYLMLMGHIGKITGYPAIRHALISAGDVNANADKDIIVIGSANDQPLVERWADHMHPLLNAGSHKLTLPGPFERLKSRWENRDLPDAMKRAGDLVTQGSGGLGALVAFESPLKADRSVVVLTGDGPAQISELIASIDDPKTIDRFHGDLVLQSGKRIDGFQLGPTYYVGKLPWWTAIRWYLSRQPLLLALLIGISALLIAIIVYRVLRRLAAKRLEERHRHAKHT